MYGSTLPNKLVWDIRSSAGQTKPPKSNPFLTVTGCLQHLQTFIWCATEERDQSFLDLCQFGWKYKNNVRQPAWPGRSGFSKWLRKLLGHLWLYVIQMMSRRLTEIRWSSTANFRSVCLHRKSFLWPWLFKSRPSKCRWCHVHLVMNTIDKFR